MCNFKGFNPTNDEKCVLRAPEKKKETLDVICIDYKQCYSKLCGNFIMITSKIAQSSPGSRALIVKYFSPSEKLSVFRAMAGSIEGPRWVLDPMRVVLSVPRVP